MLHKINRERRLYILDCGSGFTCLGFDVAYRKTEAVAAWLDRPDLAPPRRRGTKKAWRAYEAAMDAGRKHNGLTLERCPADLEPRLVGLEGCRVEVTGKHGKRRFNVGKSTGWMPCHLEVARRGSMGGPAVALFPDDNVRVVRRNP